MSLAACRTDMSPRCWSGRIGLTVCGYSRDGRPAVPQIIYGLFCAANGCSVAIEVFPGNTADPKCFSSEALTVAKRFNLGKIVFVGDRVMITSARIKDQFKDADGLDWITTLHSVDIRVLAEEGTVDKSVFDDCDHKEVTSETFPGERLAASMSNWSS